MFCDNQKRLKRGVFVDLDSDSYLPIPAINSWSLLRVSAINASVEEESACGVDSSWFIEFSVVAISVNCAGFIGPGCACPNAGGVVVEAARYCSALHPSGAVA